MQSQNYYQTADFVSETLISFFFDVMFAKCAILLFVLNVWEDQNGNEIAMLRMQNKLVHSKNPKRRSF
jgi:hypothetical protein